MHLNTPFPSCPKRQLESTYFHVYIYIHKGMVYTCPFACTPLPRPPRYKRESSRPEGELARSVRLKPANVSLPVSSICACGPLPDEARRTGNERSCTMTSTSAFFTATIAATPTNGRRGIGEGIRGRGRNIRETGGKRLLNVLETTLCGRSSRTVWKSFLL